MNLGDLCNLVEGTAVCGAGRLGDSVEYAFASDLMSDVLTIKSTDFILITGLANIQSLRTLEMSDASYMLLCRGKDVTPEMLELAEENDILIITSPYSLFRCAGILYSAGLKPLY